MVGKISCQSAPTTFFMCLFWVNSSSPYIYLVQTLCHLVCYKRIDCDLDIALDVLNEYSNERLCNSYSDPLVFLAETPTNFSSRNNPPLFWKCWLSNGIQKPNDLKVPHDSAHEILCTMCERISILDNKNLRKSGAVREMLAAIKNGDLVFLIQIISTNPDLIWILDRKGRNAIVNYDDQQNNLLHMAVKIPSDSQLSRIYGATRQMKRELQWFKEVESIVPQYYKERKNDADQTHSQVFTYNYKVLLKDAEK